MRFTETRLKGAYIIDVEPIGDERGFFARSWCKDEFRAHGLNSDLVQCSLSFNKMRGTLRGMHYQAKPYEETKLVRCTRGQIYDVIVDLRPESPTINEWVAVELSEDNHRMIFVPYGFAHGFQTLIDATEVCYQISELYHPEVAQGLLWNDPIIGIEWPFSAEPIISARDQSFPLLVR